MQIVGPGGQDLMADGDGAILIYRTLKRCAFFLSF